MQKEKGKNTAEIVTKLAEPLAAELGLTLWDVVFLKEGADWYLRIFIDKADGIGIDDCVDMTHAINPVLDSEDPIQQEYVLEVSSPGIERKLTKPAHFESYIGQAVAVKLIRPTEDGQRLFEGILLGFADGSFEVQLDEETSVTFEKKECADVHVLETEAD